jgi:phosphoglycolate phosphatase-like HAD superfamily hydrolase
MLLKDADIGKASFRRRCDDSNKCKLYPGVLDALEELAGRGTRLGVVTNLPAWIASPMLDALEISPFLQSVVCYGNTRRHKPHPEPLEAALRDLDSKATEDAWYVGDTPSDAAASAAANLSFAWAAYGYGKSPPPCDRVIQDFAEVVSL